MTDDDKLDEKLLSWALRIVMSAVSLMFVGLIALMTKGIFLALFTSWPNNCPAL